MNASFLVALGNAYREKNGPGQHAAKLAYRALANIQKILPGEKERKRSVTRFARDILAITLSPGLGDDMRLIHLLMGGNKLSENMLNFINGLDDLTDAQKLELDAIQQENHARLADYFARIGHSELNEHLGGEIKPLDLNDLTQIHGIGEATAHKLGEYKITTLTELCEITQDQLDAICAKMKLPPNHNISDWRAQACKLIACG